MKRYIVQRSGDISHFIKDFATKQEAYQFIKNYKTRDILVVNECEFNEDDDLLIPSLSEKEFYNLVDLMTDNKMDFEITPAVEKGADVVLKFKDGSFFRCLESDYLKACDYIGNPSIDPFE